MHLKIIELAISRSQINKRYITDIEWYFISFGLEYNLFPVNAFEERR